MNTPDITLPPSILKKKQTKTYGPRFIAGYGEGAQITATVRYDDECGNGHNSFAITAVIARPGARDCEACGSLHEEIARIFPELAPLIKWHLVSSDGPMHYLAKVVFHASDRDHRGLLKGEKRQLVNGRSNQPVWQRVMRDGAGHKVSGGSGNCKDSPEKPAETLTADWEPVWIEGEGKARELDHARSSAVWPDATDAELMQAPEALQAALLARLPGLMVEFKAAVESLGFTY